MGCDGSKIKPEDGDPNNDIAKLQLSKSDIKAFRKAFRKMDKDKSRSINVGEFLDALNVERTIISEEIFEDMDTSNDGHLSFKEFTLLTWRFCTRGLDSIAEFAFDIYDTDNNEKLTKKEIKEMLIESYGKLTEKHNVDSTLSMFDKDGDNKISRKEFVKAVRKVPNILQPAMFFQATLRKLVGDKEFWDRLCEKSDKIHDRPEVCALFKTKPRKVHLIKKTKKHSAVNKQESLDVKDSHHTKVNAHYYKEHHHRNEIRDKQKKDTGQRDMFSLDY